MGYSTAKAAQWIWYTKDAAPDTYGDFIDRFEYQQGPVTVRLSCDGEYTLFVNGRYVSSNQYCDFEHYKIYAQLNITDYLRPGTNEISVLVWHFGIDTFRSRKAPAGLWYEVACKDRILAVSGTDTLCRENPNYRSRYEKLITYQLGFSFLYDATADTNSPYGPAVLAEKTCALFPCPIEKPVILPPAEIRILKAEHNHYLIDCGRETMGFPTLKFRSDCAQKILVAFGEHIDDGCVRRIIDARDFSFEYIAAPGLNDYTNYMRRISCRYLEIFAESPIEVEYIGMIPQCYPVTLVERTYENPIDQKIYELAADTLKLCMMDHYVDTPWREQGLYAYDSRNQMLAGYKMFENGNRDYARANLLLISKDTRDDGLLSIVYPTGNPLSIPSFTLHYFTSVREYLDYTGDLSLGHEVYDKLISVLEAFLPQIKDGILYSFPSENHWNFYDWAPHLDEPIGSTRTRPDLMLNVLFLLALENLEVIAGKIGRDFPFAGLADSLRPTIKEAFQNKKNSLFSMSVQGDDFTELGNALAILTGLTNEAESRVVYEALRDGKLTSCSLSMKAFKYDAMLRVEPDCRPAILDEIRRTYKIMIDADATSLWETIDGASDFENAGSLCHGWSAIPVCYMD